MKDEVEIEKIIDTPTGYTFRGKVNGEFVSFNMEDEKNPFERVNGVPRFVKFASKHYGKDSPEPVDSSELEKLEGESFEVEAQPAKPERNYRVERKIHITDRDTGEVKQVDHSFIDEDGNEIPKEDVVRGI